MSTDFNPVPTTAAQQIVPSFERLLRVDEAALLLGGMHVKTLMRLARLGEVPAMKLGKHWFFRASVLNEWIDVKSGQHRPCHTERVQ